MCIISVIYISAQRTCSDLHTSVFAVQWLSSTVALTALCMVLSNCPNPPNVHTPLIISITNGLANTRIAIPAAHMVASSMAGSRLLVCLAIACPPSPYIRVL